MKLRTTAKGATVNYRLIQYLALGYYPDHNMPPEYGYLDRGYGIYSGFDTLTVSNPLAGTYIYGVYARGFSSYSTWYTLEYRNQLSCFFEFQ